MCTGQVGLASLSHIYMSLIDVLALGLGLILTVNVNVDIDVEEVESRK